MPFVDLMSEEEEPVEQVKAPQQPQATQEMGAAMSKTVQLTAEQKLILAFKAYLKSKGMYSGDISNPIADAQLIQSLQTIERKIAEALDNTAVVGMLWQGNKINPQATPQDTEKALKLIEAHTLKKDAQATVDAFDVDEYQSEPPSATKQNLTGDEAANQQLDPSDSQQIGKTIQEITNVTAMDDRIIALVKLLSV